MKKGCLIVVGILGFLFLVAFGTLYYFASEYEKMPKAPGQAECDKAEKFILSYKDREALGNTPEATQFAENYARTLRVSRQFLFTEGKEGSSGFSKGHFLTYCHAKEDSVLLLVHVPELRRYAADAKVTLSEVAWKLASIQVKKDFPKAKKLIIGIKGVMDYASIYEGKIAEDEDYYSAIIHRHSGRDEKVLWPYFVSQDANLETKPNSTPSVNLESK